MNNPCKYYIKGKEVKCIGSCKEAFIEELIFNMPLSEINKAIPEINPIPKTPFRKTDQWAKLAIRRMVRFAASENYDRIAWTNGDMQAERYDLSKQINYVDVNPYKTYREVTVEHKTGSFPLTINNEGVITNGVSDYIGKKIDEVLGKELSEKIMSSDNKIRLSGIDLNVGGEGMKAFYDQIIPSEANKLIKSFGLKTEPIKIDINPTITESGIDTENGVIYDNVDKYREVLSFPINQSLKETALGGLPLFNQETELPENPSAQYVVDNIDKYEQHYNNIKNEIDKFAKGMNVNVKVVRSKLNLPKYIQKEMERMNSSQGSGRYLGVYDRKTKTIYIVANDCKGIVEAKRTAAHEIIAHYGLRNLLGKDFASTMELVYRNMTEAQRNDIIKKYGYDVNDHTNIADEFAARVAEEEKIPSWFAIVIAKIRKFIRDKFGFNLNINSGDLVYLLWKSKNKLSDDSTAGEVMDYIVKEDHVENNAMNFQIIGEKGAEMIDNHEQVIDNLRVAKEMEVSGKDAKTIRIATGWEKGADGLWRYEIPDGKLKLSIENIINLKSDNGLHTNSLPLSDVLDNKELFDVYPEFKNFNVIFYQYGTRFGNSTPDAFYDDEKKLVGIATNKNKREKYTSDLRRELGSNDVSSKNGAYNDDTLKSSLLHEIQHIIQTIEKFNNGTNPEKALENAIMERYENIQTNPIYLRFSDSEKKEIAKQDVLKENNTIYSREAAQSLYHRSAGEVEARNTQRRRNLSESEKRNTLFADTEDVARDEQIILREGGDMAMSVETNNEDSSLNGDMKENPFKDISVKPIEKDYELSEDNQANFEYDLADALGRKLGSARFDYFKKGDAVIRIKGHSPNWSNFYEDINELGVKSILNITVGNYNNRDYRSNKTNLEEFEKENPQIKVIDIQVEDGESLQSVLDSVEMYLNKENTPNINFKREDDTITINGVERPTTNSNGNNGDFDLNDPNINFKREEDIPPEGSNKKYIDSKAKRFTQGIQNKDLPLKLMEEDLVKESGVKLDDNNSAYMWSDKYKSGAGKQMLSFERNQIRPLIDAVKEITDKTGKDMKAVSDYLLAKHSIERHQAGEVSALSEEPDAEWNMEKATAIVDEFEKSVPKELVDDLWSKVRTATRFSLDYAFMSGFMDIDTYDKLTSQYQYYVPLRGWDFTEKINPLKYYNFVNEEAKGNTFQNPLIKAKGRTSKPADPLPHIVAMGESAIIYGMKNQFKKRLLNLARQHMDRKDVFELRRSWEVLNPLTGEWNETYEPSQDLLNERKKIYEEIKRLEKTKKGQSKEYIKAINEEIKLLKDGINIRNSRNAKNDMYIPKSAADQRVVTIWDAGVKYELSFSDPEVANAVNGIDNKVWILMGNEQANKMFLKRMTNWLSANFTSKNPAFIAPNMIRDLMFATTSHWINDEGTLLEFYKNMPKAAAAIHRYIRETDSNENFFDNELKTFFEFGGATGYTQLKDLEKIAKNIQEEVFGKKGFRKLSANTQLYTGLHHLGKLMDYTAMQSELISRFATYLAAKKAGKSTFEAIDMAKNITVNFDRKGEWTGILGALFAFFNPSVQGVNVVNKMYKKNKMRFIAACFMPLVMGFVNNLLLSMTKGDGDDDKYPTDFELSNNIMFRVGDGYAKIPLPPFFRAFWGMGVQLHRAMFSGETKTKDAIYNVMDGIVNATSPINIMSGTKELQKGKLPLRPVTPTVLVPVYDLWVNEDFKGNPVYRKMFTEQLEEFTPDSEKGFKSTNKIISDLFKEINEAGGGDKYTIAGTDRTGKTEGKWFKNMLDYNPAMAEHLVEYITGGRGKFVNDITKTLISMADKEVEFNSYNLPIANRFYSTSTAKRDISSEFYGVKDRINTYEYYLSQSKTALQKGEPQSVPFVDMIKETDMLVLKEKQDIVDMKLKEITRQLDENPDRQTIKELREERQKVMKEFVDEFNSRIEKRGE